ncbi:antirestriction protein ArdA [Sphingorhabdus lutea]|uniref:Antirestriction protein ArdA n=1 Tax=Sphingorhabdus lutea TaxID=1913578 RepID=A0A1L3JDB6_9SPHN|nr:antirestriction protein ArdA [Sphingorhabdus lutea]APG63125.1 antirestriction protein ArdA [Sphingorhabdus lutea]
MTTFFAQPYSIDATGFYFETSYEFQESSRANRDRYGNQVEEYEIQFIDGERIDAHLAEAHGLYQSNISEFIDFVDIASDEEKIRFIIAVRECGYDASCNIGEIDIDIYEMDTLKELAEQFVDEGLFGEIPTNLRNYLDYDAIAYDLGMDYSETSIAGTNYVYRSG